MTKKTQKIMDRIKLTEQDLHFLVEEAVKTYLTENDMEEGIWGGLKSLGQRAGNKMQTAAGNVADKVGGRMQQAGQVIGNAYNKAADAIGNTYNQAAANVKNTANNVKQTYQTGAATSDAQKAVQNAIQALNNLLAADQKLTSMGQYSVLGKQAGAIQRIISTLKSASGRFGARNSAFVKR